MSTATKNLIFCPGCDNVVIATTAVCPGCGRCVGCGKRRVHHQPDCPTCKIPYCNCCGRCAACQDLRYSSVVTVCQCGHPENPEAIQDLIEQHGLTAKQ